MQLLYPTNYISGLPLAAVSFLRLRFRTMCVCLHSDSVYAWLLFS